MNLKIELYDLNWGGDEITEKQRHTRWLYTEEWVVKIIWKESSWLQTRNFVQRDSRVIMQWHHSDIILNSEKQNSNEKLKRIL